MTYYTCPFARIKKQFLPFEQLCICIGRRVWICVNIACAQSLPLRRCLGSYRPTEQYHWCVILVGRWTDREVAEVDQFRRKSWTQTFKIFLPQNLAHEYPILGFERWGLANPTKRWDFQKQSCAILFLRPTFVCQTAPCVWHDFVLFCKPVQKQPSLFSVVFGVTSIKS